MGTTKVTHFNKVCGKTGLYVGADGSEIEVASTAGALTATTTLTIGSTALTATGDEINRKCDVSTRLVTITGTGDITAAANEGKINLLGEVGGNAIVTLTLPAATGSGAVYTFIVSVLNTQTYVIRSLTTDTMVGSAYLLDNDSTAVTSYSASGTDDYITINGTTTGGLVGDKLVLVDFLAATWAVHYNGNVPTGSNIADPFAAT